MAQVTKPAYDEARIPFDKMSFSPDVPATALGANEYNAGINVETDVRGMRSVAGEQEVLASIPGTPTFISSGFRQDGYYWYIVATDEGRWWANRGDSRLVPSGNGGIWIDITPVEGPYTAYSQNINICDSWNGTIPFFNDTFNAPMFWPDVEPIVLTTTGASGTGTSATLAFATLSAQPYAVGDIIIVEGVTPAGYNGVHTVTACTTSSVAWSSAQTGAQTVSGFINGPVPQMIQYLQH